MLGLSSAAREIMQAWVVFREEVIVPQRQRNWQPSLPDVFWTKKHNNLFSDKQPSEKVRGPGKSVVAN